MDRLAALESRVVELTTVCANQSAMIAQLALAIAAMQAAMMESAERLPGERAEVETVGARH